ncbi:MAG: preprotein translocase subunit YajC [Acidobacteria bacterium]|jgi:preprotein translocase subunit YajC|nr:MAG: preprotein translocase subunit YajC [Acidobacteriota bacterium]PYS64320.1 MAG: preprotein translocase subunit YajC [Acidobacteriota bacterium]
MFLFLFQGGIGGLGGALIPMLLIFGVFYLLLIRPQQKKQRELQATIAELKAGDKVVTTGGVIGVITAVRDTSFLIRSADKSILEIARSAVAGVDSEEKK